MRQAGAAVILALLLAPGSPGQRQRKRPQPKAPLDDVRGQDPFDLQQFTGTWFLVGMASECGYLRDHSHQLEATALHAEAVDRSLAFGTFRKLDGICWNVKQWYGPTKTNARFLLRGRGSGGSVDLVVGETDYSQYAILYFQKQRRLSIKLYVRAVPASDQVLSRFEQRVLDAKLSEDVTYYFPTYGFCDSADEFHVLDERRG
ncbi:complement component C8 gamma chain [Tachyglossus aculeatus]|uniref:complement component C8 gamma chain n=1 Tax=Tachyglossus aculeatus TaxID=9261 RepID=UPI0018F58DB9|nr:complement component C8 gamma chain [Tachyglossus aculeatus]